MSLFAPTVFPEASGQDLCIWRTQFETSGAGSKLDMGSGEILDFIMKENLLFPHAVF